MMKRYLDLVPISAKLHKKQSRMTRICILLSVFLVSVIFSMADMEIRSQKMLHIQTQGGWHAGFKNINAEQAALIAARPEVTGVSWYGVKNYGLNAGYSIEGTETVICGFDEGLLEMFPASGIREGTFPTGTKEAVLTKSIRDRLGLRIGDSFQMASPAGQVLEFTVTGFTGDTSLLTSKDAFGIFLNMESYRQYFYNPSDNDGLMYYATFSSRSRIESVIDDISSQLGLPEESIAKNVTLLGLMGQSDNSYMLTLYGAAAVLAVLVILAGIFMISGSLNSNVSQRTQFFGMLRCLGASGKQVARFVRWEALNWCRGSMPAGLLAGTVTVWILCFVLKVLSPSYFGGMPLFAVSWAGLAAGALIGLATVLLASRAPAKRASRVSPLTAVSGNTDPSRFSRKAAGTRFLKVETALGVHHAKSSKKNLFLMTCSFAFSIVLFLSFTSVVDFIHHAIRPLRPYTPDLSIVSPDNTLSVSPEALTRIAENPSVKRAYGRMFAYNVPVTVDGLARTINLVSYDDQQFQWWAEENLLEGGIEEAQNGTGLLLVYAAGDPADTGGVMTIDCGIGPRQLKITGLLSDSPFTNVPGVDTVICSEELFRQLTGASGYTILDVQLNSGATDQDVADIRAVSGPEASFHDYRIKNSEIRGAYYSMSLFIYGFLAVIALITVFNIINSISMSVNARLNSYGTMRAVGMSAGQVIRMIAAEALTYVSGGVLLGCALGLPLNRLVYEWMITSHWGTPWYLPAASLCTIVLLVALSAVLAVAGPARRIRSLSVADTISAQ